MGGINVGAESLAAAGRVFDSYMRLGVGKRVLVVADGNAPEVVAALAAAAASRGVALEVRDIVPTGAHGAEPDAETAATMRGFDAILAPTGYSLTHTAAAREARAAGVVVATLPGIDIDIFRRGMRVDPEELRRTGNKWIEVFGGKRRITVVNGGSELSFQTGARPWINDDGCFFARQALGNLPAGEIFIAPDAGTAEGELLVDGTISGQKWAENQQATTLTIAKGAIIGCTGLRGERLVKTLTSRAGDKGLVLAEFGVGTNPGLRMGGNLLEDEKVKGTIHIAFGNNRGFGGDNDAPIHIDCMAVRPTVKVDGETVIDQGKWLAVE